MHASLPAKAHSAPARTKACGPDILAQTRHLGIAAQNWPGAKGLCGTTLLPNALYTCVQDEQDPASPPLEHVPSRPPQAEWLDAFAMKTLCSPLNTSPQLPDAPNKA